MKETYCRRGICISVEMMQVMLGERGVCVENMLRNQQAVTDVLTNICYFVRCECVKVICLFSFVFFTAVSYFFFLSFFLFLAHFFRSLVFHVYFKCATNKYHYHWHGSYAKRCDYLYAVLTFNAIRSLTIQTNNDA